MERVRFNCFCFPFYKIIIIIILVDCVQSTVKEALTNISSHPFLTIPSLPNMPQIISKLSFGEEVSVGGEEAELPEPREDVSDDDSLDHLRQSFDRLTKRRVTDFSQV